jgi:hypothetical protein
MIRTKIEPLHTVYARSSAQRIELRGHPVIVLTTEGHWCIDRSPYRATTLVPLRNPLQHQKNLLPVIGIENGDITEERVAALPAIAKAAWGQISSDVVPDLPEGYGVGVARAATIREPWADFASRIVERQKELDRICDEQERREGAELQAFLRLRELTPDFAGVLRNYHGGPSLGWIETERLVQQYAVKILDQIGGGELYPDLPMGHRIDAVRADLADNIKKES